MKRMLSVPEKAVLSRMGVIKSAVKRYLGNDYADYVDDAVQDILCKALERITGILVIRSHDLLITQPTGLSLPPLLGHSRCRDW